MNETLGGKKKMSKILRGGLIYSKREPEGMNEIMSEGNTKHCKKVNRKVRMGMKN